MGTVMNSTIGLLGGTFDPIHLGHLHLALSVYNALDLQEVWLIPSGQPLLRNPPIATPVQRLAMVEAAIEGHPHLNVDDREIKRGGFSYTIDTLAAIRADVGETPLCFIVSADRFSYFDEWRDWQDLTHLAHFVVTTRAGYDFAPSKKLKAFVKERAVKNASLLHQAKSGCIFFQPIIPLTISATQVRDLLLAGNNPQIFLPDKVWKYICENGLYR